MRSKSVLLMVIVLLICGISVFAQDEGEKEKKEELTIEELYLLNPEILIIREMALASDRESKIQALDGIARLIEEGAATEEVEDTLIYLGGEGSYVKQYEGYTQINNFPEVRRRSCNLLGLYGGERAVGALITVLRHETESMVMSEAAYALGTIGLDEGGEVSRALAYAISNQDILNPDSNFAYAVILAFQKLAEKNNGLNDPAAYRSLIMITQGNFIRGVKMMALNTLRDMKKYNK